jgi:ADP-ribose pyrophosphatase YjhB (NUDIX family)
MTSAARPASPDAPPPVKRSVSLAVREPGGSGLLLVRRPPDDAELPGVWGLPAATLTDGEGWEQAVRRAAREKLGVEVEVGPELNRGAQVRAAYRLEMRLYAATLTGGTPRVPQPRPGVTQYSEWRWGRAEQVRPAAEQGSLCSQLLLGAG